jgi:hypothetical protein
MLSVLDLFAMVARRPEKVEDQSALICAGADIRKDSLRPT